MKKSRLGLSIIYIIVMLGFLCVCSTFAEALTLDHTSASHMKIDEIFGESFWDQFNLHSLSDISTISFTVSGNHAYQLMGNGVIYQMNLQNMDYSLLCQVLTLPTACYSAEMLYSDLDEAVKAHIDDAVFQIIGDISEERLYGYCPVSGKIGIIDETGIHWSKVMFDNKVTNRSKTAYPEALSCAFVDGNMMYAFVDQSICSDEPCQGALASFDLRSGECVYTKIPGTYAFCPYEDDQLLLLAQDIQGRMCLDSYRISTGERENVISLLPVEIPPECGDDWFSIASIISGLSYNKAKKEIFLANENGLWQWDPIKHFSQINLEGEVWATLTPYSQAWVARNGRYIFHNGENYVIIDNTE